MLKKNSKIVFILASISQPRCIKRIKSFMSNGYVAKVYGFDRKKYNENIKNKDIPIKIIGEMQDGTNNFNKFFISYKTIKNILNSYNLTDTYFYSFGFIQTLTLKLLGCKTYIYEISDIAYGYKRWNFVRWLFRLLDLYLIKNSILTVLTSEGFSRFLFKKKIPENVLIQPNKMDFLFFKSERPENNTPLNCNKLIFSFVGAFRYPNTVFRFARIIGEKYPNHEFHFYGDSRLTNEVIKLSKLFDNIKYFGPFKNPQDLSKIYNKIDIIVACYDIENLNERIAEPNKLYESLYFRKPIIVSKNTFLAEKLKQFGCGFSINASDDKSIESFISLLNIEKLQEINKNIENIKLEEMIDDNSNAIISFIQRH